MPYKIVQTIEKGKTILVIVPSLWEEKGSLWWPPPKILQKLIKNEKSKPDKKQWRLLNCILKRQNMRSYQLAEAEIALMEVNSDTDGNDTGCTNIVAPRTTQAEEEINHEIMANKLRYDQENQRNEFTDYTTLHTNDTATEDTTNHEKIVQLISTETLNFDQVLVNQKILSDKIDSMLQIQAITLDNQQKIVQKLATQSLQIEEISVQLAEMRECPSVTLLKDINTEDAESFIIKPIENQQDLISLDQLLADRAEKFKLQKRLSFLCSASKGEGKTCAYKLLDILFTRDFFCKCSWAGGSRGDMSKIALKDYKNVLKFFHSMIQTWDPIYTVQENESFFKTISKNSKQRKLMKNLRMSSKRHRKNKENVCKQQKSENKIQPNDDKHGPNDVSKDTEGENVQIVQHTHKEIFEEESNQIQKHGPTNVSKETKEENMQIEEYIFEGESMLIQGSEIKKEAFPLNNMSDDDSQDEGLC